LYLLYLFVQVTLKVYTDICYDDIYQIKPFYYHRLFILLNMYIQVALQEFPLELSLFEQITYGHITFN